MMTLDEIKAQLEDRRIPIVAERTGLAHSTIYAIRDGRTANPGYGILKALSDYLQGQTA